MCSVVICARVFFREPLCRQIAPLCITSRREKHFRTRPIIKKVKPIHVKGVLSKPLPDHGPWRPENDREYDFNFEEDDNPLADIDDPTVVAGYAKGVREEVNERARKLKKILVKKESEPEPRESNLLHWAARQQIRYLHKKDPLEWSPESIAEEFPISVQGAKRLLRGNLKIAEDQIEAFDEEVDERWKLLRKIKHTGEVPEKGRVHLHEKTIELYLKGELQSEILKSGNPDFPKAPPLLDIKVPYPVGREGKHFAVFQEYKNLLGDGNPDEGTNVSTTVKSANAPGFTPDQEIDDDPESATHLDLPRSLKDKLVRTRSSETMTLDDFKKNADIKKMAEIAGAKEVKEKIKKKKLVRSAKPFVATRKFRDTPKKTSHQVESDGTYTVGRTVFSADGEILYRQGR